jgi:hypothetical protein
LDTLEGFILDRSHKIPGLPEWGITTLRGVDVILLCFKKLLLAKKLDFVPIIVLKRFNSNILFW